MGSKKERVMGNTKASKKKQESEYMAEGRSKSKRNLYELKNAEKRMKKTMQRVMESSLEDLEALEEIEDLYEGYNM